MGIWLKKSSGSKDAAVASVHAGRHGSHMESIIGMVRDRLRMDNDDSFEDLLKRARAQCLAVLSHATVPFDGVVRDQRASGDDVDVNALLHVFLSYEEVNATPVPISDHATLVPINDFAWHSKLMYE